MFFQEIAPKGVDILGLNFCHIIITNKIGPNITTLHSLDILIHVIVSMGLFLFSNATLRVLRLHQVLWLLLLDLWLVALCSNRLIQVLLVLVSDLLLLLLAESLRWGLTIVNLLLIALNRLYYTLLLQLWLLKVLWLQVILLVWLLFVFGIHLWCLIINSLFMLTWLLLLHYISLLITLNLALEKVIILLSILLLILIGFLSVWSLRLPHLLPLLLIRRLKQLVYLRLFHYGLLNTKVIITLPSVISKI